MSINEAASRPLLAPIIALSLWTFAMEGWMYARRLPAIQQAKLRLEPSITQQHLDRALPPQAQWPAHNYNHLMEQPTVFYAVALSLALLDVNDGKSLGLAWAYVGLRVVHSLIQATYNPIMARFSVFILSSFTLLGLTLRAAVEVF